MNLQLSNLKIMNYMFGLIAFSFIDVGLAIVQSVSYYYYSTKAADMVIMLGQNPFTTTTLPLYLQETAYMSGMMGWAAIIVAPLTVSVVFKGETMAAMGAYNSAMGMYKGDKGGQNLSDSLKRSSAVHSVEAQEYERYAREHEEHAKRQLSDWGITPPQGVLASDMWAQVSAEAEQLGGSVGIAKLGKSEYGTLENFSQTRATAGGGTGELNVRKSIASGLGAAEMFSNDGVGDDFSYQTQTDSEKSIATIAAKGKSSQEIDGLDRDSQITASKATANKALADEVGAGMGLMDTDAFDENGNLINNDKTKAMIKGAELSSLQKANMQIGTGEAGNVDDYAEVALEDGQIAAKTVNATNKRRNQLDGTNGTEAWDEDKIADGQAISSVQQQIKAQGVSNALEKEGQDNDDAFRQAAMGSEFSGRKEENDQLGIGKKWTELTNSDKNHNGTRDDIDLMSMEQENVARGAIGGILTANKDLHTGVDKNGNRYNRSVDQAIKDDVTNATSKAMEASATASQLRKNYGDDLNTINKAGETILENAQNRLKKAKDDKAKAQNEIDTAQEYINNKDNLTADKSKKMTEHQATLKDAKKALASANNEIAKSQSAIDSHPEDMRLSDVASLNAQSKIASTAGQAAGIQENIDKGVSYAENAMYGEMSKQQSTKAKLDAQGGVYGAVNTDVADASIKAAMQQQALSGSMQEYLQSKEGGSHSKEESEKMAQAILKGGSQAAEAMKNV